MVGSFTGWRCIVSDVCFGVRNKSVTYLKRQIDPNEGKHCLFCVDFPATWVYAANTKELLWHWAVCEGCSILIDNDLAFPLVNRFLRSHCSELKPSVLRPLAEYILEEFKNHAISGSGHAVH